MLKYVSEQMLPLQVADWDNQFFVVNGDPDGDCDVLAKCCDGDDAGFFAEAPDKIVRLCNTIDELGRLGKEQDADVDAMVGDIVAYRKALMQIRNIARGDHHMAPTERCEAIVLIIDGLLLPPRRAVSNA